MHVFKAFYKDSDGEHMRTVEVGGGPREPSYKLAFMEAVRKAFAVEEEGEELVGLRHAGY